jgi:hypothetical protein
MFLSCECCVLSGRDLCVSWLEKYDVFKVQTYPAPGLFCDDAEWYGVLAPLLTLTQKMNIVNSECGANRCYFSSYCHSVKQQCQQISFLGAFAKLRKANINFGISVNPSLRPSVHLLIRTEQLDSHWTNFHKI